MYHSDFPLCMKYCSDFVTSYQQAACASFQRRILEQVS
jgi:hypothetical protein